MERITCTYCGQTFLIEEESPSRQIATSISYRTTAAEKGCGHTLRVCLGSFFIILGAFGAYTDESERFFGLGMVLFGITLLPAFHLWLRQRMKINIPNLPILLPIAVFIGSAFLLD